MKYITVSIILIVIGGAIIFILDERFWSQTSALGYVGIALFTGGIVLIPLMAFYNLVKSWL